MQVLVVRDKDGKEIAKINPQAYNAQERLNSAVQQAGSGGTADLEEVSDFIDLLGIKPIR